MESVKEPKETYEDWSDKRGYASGDYVDPIHFLAKKFNLQTNISIAQAYLLRDYENDLRATEGKLKALNHLAAAQVQIEQGVDTF